MLLSPEHILNAALVSVVIAVIQWCMEDGMILGWYRKWLERKAFEWRYSAITKPMGLCSFCMTFWIAFPVAVFSLGLYPVQIITFTALSMFFDKVRVQTLH